MAISIWTIGHSTRSSEEFNQTLAAHRIELVVDVRRFPGSRRLPHFATSELERHLARRHILYHWIPLLGGRRRASGRSTNTGWRAAGFRAYVDHIARDDFAEGLLELLMLAYGMRTAIMCAELLWWRCHRRLIADVLTSIGFGVWHVRGQEAPSLHRIELPARLVRGVLTYEAR